MTIFLQPLISDIFTQTTVGKDASGNYTTASVKGFLEYLIATLKSNPKLSSVVFPTDVTPLAQGFVNDKSIENLVQQLTASFTGNICTSEFNFKVLNTYSEVAKSLLPLAIPPLTLTATTTNTSCSLDNGSVKLNATGGTPPYQYSKDGITFQTSAIFENLAVGTYTIIVKDNVGKTASTSVTISKDTDNEVERTTYEPPILGNARVSGKPLTVQWDASTTPYTFTPKAGITLTRIGNGKLQLTTTNPEDKQWEGEYGVYFKANDHNTFIGFYNETMSGICTPSGYTLDCKPLCKERWLPEQIYLQTFDVNKGEFESYEEYKTTLGTNAIPENKWTGQDAHWLKSDRDNCTIRWKNSCWNIIKYDLKDRLQPFSQIRDFYKWVRYETELQGHEVRWAKGADLLVHGLARLDYLFPPLDSYALGDEYVKLLKELNVGIANYSLHRWKVLLIDNANTPIIGTNAYNWDKSFIYEEQGQIAPPIYNKYEQSYPEAIRRMNSMVHHDVTDNPGELGESIINLVVAATAGIPAFDQNVPCTDTQYRIDFPLKMLYPQIHNPVHSILIRRGNQDFLNVPFLPITFCNP